MVEPWWFGAACVRMIAIAIVAACSSSMKSQPVNRFILGPLVIRAGADKEAGPTAIHPLEAAVACLRSSGRVLAKQEPGGVYRWASMSGPGWASGGRP